jgi:glycosyltransferase involved in cell wall biosynthesis
MMVRNEASVIRRAMESVMSIIDYWIICDTGSEDDTRDIIRDTLKDIPGELHEVPWINFGHNRTQVIQLASGKADYILIMDADMTANVHAPFKHLLTADAYEIRYEGNDSYTQRMLVSAAIPWRFVGVTHEYIDSDELQTVDWLPALSLTHFGDGGMRSDKFERDIRLLSEALQTDPGNARYIFYLAQSYKDLRRYEEALPWFRERAAMEDSWDEERWFAQKQVGRMMLRCNHDWKETYRELMEAYRMRPWRLEPLHLIVQQLRIRQEYEQGYRLAAFIAQGIEFPSQEILFIDKPVYDYLLLLEYGVCAMGTGRATEALAAFNKILERDDLPEDVEASARRGRKIALEHLYPQNDEQGEKNRIVVLSVVKQAGERLQEHVQSLQEQDHDNFHIVFVYDGQLDVSVLPMEDDRVTLLPYQAREGAAAGIHEAVTDYCAPGDVVILTDAEDVLLHEKVLSQIDALYRGHDCWVLCGQYMYKDGRYGKAGPVTGEAALREERKLPQVSHSNSFRAGLYQVIANADEQYDCLKDDEGHWFKGAPVTALMTCLYELAGTERLRYTEEAWLQRNSNDEDAPDWLTAAQRKNNLSSIAGKRPFAALKDYNSVTEKEMLSVN